MSSKEMTETEITLSLDSMEEDLDKIFELIKNHQPEFDISQYDENGLLASMTRH
jgi:hypothetical protein